MAPKKLYCLFVFCFSISSVNGLFAAVSVKRVESADTKSSNTPVAGFNHPIRHWLVNSAGTLLFATADADADTKEFAAVVLKKDSSNWMPLTPINAQLNREQNAFTKNPLYDQSIAHAVLMEGENPAGSSEGRLVVVTKAEPNTLYLINNYYKKTILKEERGTSEEVAKIKEENSKKQPEAIIEYTTSLARDAAGNDHASIVSMAASNAFVFAAVTPRDKPFGQLGSGIAMTVLGTVPVEEENPDPNNPAQRAVFAPLDVPTGMTRYNLKKVKKNDHAYDLAARALPFDVTIPALAIGEKPLASVTIKDMYWSPEHSTLYIAVSAQTADDPNSGVRAIVAGRVQGQVLRFLPIVINDAALESDSIIAVRGALKSISIDKVRTMVTSTMLNYLIVVKENMVHALPLVRDAITDQSKNYNGLVARKDVLPKVTAQKNNPSIRHFNEAAHRNEHMITAHDPAGLVGGGALPKGIVAAVFTRADVAYVVVESEDLENSGVYCSQALLDAAGAIKGWTKWRRAVSLFSPGGAPEKVFDAMLNTGSGEFLCLCADENGKKTEVKYTQWQAKDEKNPTILPSLISSVFPKEKAGVHAIVDIPANSPGLPDSSLQVLTGLGTVMLVQTSSKHGDCFVPHPIMQCTYAEHTKGTLINKSARAHIITGGELADLGPITAAEVICKGDSATLIVGGVQGLAVLSAADGSWWSAVEGIGNNFEKLPSLMTFKKIGNHRFVRKLLYDDGMLYVLTDQQLDRIDLSSGDFNPVTVAHTRELWENPGIFFDFVVSDKLALLATSEGIWRVGNSRDVRLGITAGDMQWTKINLPEGFASVRQLQVISNTGRIQDVARQEGGMIYALNGYRGKGLSKIYRLIISSTEKSEISNATVQLLMDSYIKDSVSSFINFGGYRTFFSTDGIMYMHLGNKEDGQAAIYTTPYDYIVERLRNKAIKPPSIELPVKLDGKMATSILQSSALGNRMIVGDFGMYMQW